MRNRTTLCYIKYENKWLFIRKERKGDNNEGKYLGIGGHIEEGESPDECIRREISEETGLCEEDLKDLKLMGDVDFFSDIYGYEKMYVYSAELKDIEKNPTSYVCDEGTLMWVDIEDSYDLPLWEGDKKIFDRLRAEQPFKMTLKYEGERLAAYKDEAL